MSTYRELLSRVDLLLDEPHAASPSIPVRWEVMRGALQQMTNIVLDAPPAWSIHNVDFTVADGVDTYTLVANDFGKPVLIETVNSGDPYHVPRPIAISSIESLLSSAFPGSSGEDLGGNGVLHTARAIALYRDSGNVKVRVFPVPSMAATYRVYYEVASANDDSLDNQMVMPALDNAIVYTTVVGCLPRCKWSNLTDAANAAKRSEMLKVYAPLALQQEREARRYLATDKQSGRATLTGYDDAGYLSDQNR